MAGSRDIELSSPLSGESQTIGAFARTVGLTPSALRQYGVSGLLVPSEVDERTGYRYYASAQRQRAIWIRRLRDAGIRLSTIRDILDGDPRQSEAILDDWLKAAGARHLAASELASDLRISLRSLTEKNPQTRTLARLDGAVLATAIDQAARASEPGRDRVLLELGSGKLTVVGTSRYLLITRLNVASEVDGPRVRVCFDVPDLAAWLRSRRRVELVVDSPIGRDQTNHTRAQFTDESGDTITPTCQQDLFPDIFAMINDDVAGSTRAVFARDDVRRVTKSRHDRVVLRVRDSQATLGPEEHAVVGSSRGPQLTVELSSALTQDVAEAAVGPLLTCDMEGPGRPLIWRAPSQPDFIALFMPRVS